MPLYRLEAIFERMGVQIDRGTMCVWMRDIAELALPLQQFDGSTGAGQPRHRDR
jgi:transposase